VSDPPTPSGGGGHYFDAAPSVASRRSRVRLDLPDTSMELTTDRGVFAADAVDTGTKLLLLEGPSPATDPATATGTLLDLGCGYGPIALTLARRAPSARVWAVDVNERARELCRLNADAAGLTNVSVAAPDEVPTDLWFDGIWSNPPIRVGKGALHELLLTWLARLEPHGRAWLVVQKHLGADSLVRWLDDHGHPTSRLTSRQAYRILEVAAQGEVEGEVRPDA
jgi:16S rRNA (guanine1207-N2)-methyltransferase